MRRGLWLGGLVVFCLVAAAGGGLALANNNGLVDSHHMTARVMGPITVASGWQQFSWSAAPPTDAAENPFTFTLTQPGYLSVVDCYIDGDQFEVRDGTTLIATTSVPKNDGYFVGTPDAAWADHPDFSWASIPLAAGAHSINIRLIAAAAGPPGGAAFLRVDNEQFGIPVPTLGWAGLVGLAALLAAAGFIFLRRS